MRFEGKDLSPDFTLAIKHNAGFTALLDRLVGRYPCYGIVRHPLAVLSSWNSVQLSVQQGHVPVGEQIDAGLREALERIGDRTERQFYVLEWFFERFSRLLPRASILRYEDIVATGGRALMAVTPAAGALGGAAGVEKPQQRVRRNAVSCSWRAAARRPGAFWEFYERGSVEEMLDAPQPG